MESIWQLVLLPFSLLCAVIPMVAFLGLVWWLDRYDREPIWLVLLTFAWGALGGVLFALLGSSLAMEPLAMLVGPEQAEQLAAVIIAPLVEEPTKAMILFVIMFSRHFDHAADGFVYGAAAGLGFGMTENFLYFTSMGSDPMTWFGMVVIRTFFSAVMHACATSCVGAVLGFARFRGWGAKILALPMAFIPAMSIHALWNGLLTLDAYVTEWELSWFNFALFPLEVMILFGIFQAAIWDERRLIRRELADEVVQGLLPLAHATAIAGYFSRKKPGWVPAGVPQDAYIKAATTLALRKHQCRYASQRAYPFYHDDVLRLRREIQGLLALAKG
ncbi:MAG TPA: PrsW family intramembrane metalloprotease [Myxococcota bacterium]|nr:PrsW family intramembrane metalloprotease [Myxococcota bacterium]HNH46172.1 PrsW family intramembrane metalloprotease [Myxococcota bacterium]